MKKHVYGLFFLVFAALPFSATMANSNSGFEDYLPGKKVSIENFEHSNQTIYAVLEEGAGPIAFFRADRQGARNFYEEKNDIIRMLDGYYLSRKIQRDKFKLFSDIHEKILQVKEAKKDGESECRRLLGTDRYSCDSFDSCLLACFAGPFCPNFVYGGEPGEFVRVMWNFENSTKALMEAYAKEKAAYGELSKKLDVESAKKYVEAIDKINAAATALNRDPLFAYSFCFKPDYGIAEITRIQMLAYQNMEELYPFQSFEKQASRIMETTQMLKEKMSKRKNNLTIRGAEAIKEQEKEIRITEDKEGAENLLLSEIAATDGKEKNKAPLIHKDLIVLAMIMDAALAAIVLSLLAKDFLRKKRRGKH